MGRTRFYSPPEKIRPKKLEKSKVFLTAIVVFTLGIGLASFFKTPTGLVIGVFVLSFVVLIWGIFWSRRDFLIYALIVAVFGLGLLKAGNFLESNRSKKFDSEDFSYLSLVFKLKEAFTQNLNKVLPEPQASLASALLVGDKSGLPKDLSEDFSKTGTSHIVVVSGYNISIISLIIFESLGLLYLSRFWRFLGTVFAIFVFAVVTGFEASVIRAGVMGSLLVLAWHQGRLYNILNAVGLAGALMLYLNPGLLRYDLGFKLSFLAVLGLIFLDPMLKRGFLKLGFPERVLDFLSPTLAAQIMTLPLIAFYFGQISLIAPLANLLVLPLIPLTMFFSFVAGIIPFLSYFLGKILVLPAWLFLSYEIKVIHWLSLAPWASFSAPNVSIFLVFIYYVLVFIFIWRFYVKSSQF